MAVLVFTENWEGKFKKSTYEAVSYANDIAKMLNTTTTAIAIGNINENDLQGLGKYGASKILKVTNDKLKDFDPQAYSIVIGEAAKKENATIVIVSGTYSGKSLAGRIAVRIEAGIVSGAIALPSSTSPFTVRKKCFSGKGFTDVEMHSEKKVILLTPNSHKVSVTESQAQIEEFSPALSDNDFKTKVKEVKKTAGKISLTEAERVVSAGRGMKGAENWKMIEELAEVLDAATACSKPVADIGWRPHHEHVGQTGITIGPNLYVAIGISGAIQHLAGVSSSKVIVVINSDPEAPFFKAADYGIVGDAFQIVPKLTESIKKFKEAHH